jgi:hypothetical protein
MNSIQEMRKRLTERFSGAKKPMEGLDISYTMQRVTQNTAPRLPQSNISSQKARYSRAGRPTKTEPQKYKKWEGWL